MTIRTGSSESESEVITSSTASLADDSESQSPQCLKEKFKCQKKAGQSEAPKCKKKEEGKNHMNCKPESKPKKAKCERLGEKEGKHAEASESETESDSTSEDAWASSSEAETIEDEASSAAATSTEIEQDRSVAESAASEPSPWSVSEDAILCSMRRGGESLAEIAESLGRPKAELKARLKVLVNDARFERAKQVLRKKHGTMVEVNGKKKKCEKRQQQTKAKKRSSKSEESEEYQKDDEKTHQSDTESCQKPSQASVNSAARSDEGSEYRLQQVYLNNCIRAELYPQRINLKSDDALTQIDCEILACIDAQQHHTRWLAVQAIFYNTTGRMLPLEVIRQRCEAAEWKEMLRKLDEQGDGHLAEKVQSWMQGVYV